MVKNDIYQRNLITLKKSNPAIADKIEQTDVSILKFCKTSQGEENLFEAAGEQAIYLHAQTGAMQETKDWWKELEVDKEDCLLFVYGIGMGYFYPVAKPWLEANPDRFLIFLEDNYPVFKRFLETDLASEILHASQVKVIFLPEQWEKHIVSDFFVDLCDYFFGLKEKFTVLPFYRKANVSRAEFLELIIREQTKTTHLYVLSHLAQAEILFENMCENFLRLGDAKEAATLQNTFRNIPAIICGAGSSIHKNLDQLFRLKDKALFFAGGATISLLMNHAISPHFCAALDPSPPYKRYFLQTGFEIPLFFHPRSSFGVVSLFHGQHLCLPSVRSVPFEEWMRRKLGMPEVTLEPYSTVTDALVNVAAKLGCNPIIFVGVDLSFTEGRYYAKGVAKDTTTLEEEKLISKKDIHGHTVYTKMDWIRSADLIGDIAKSYSSRTFINATEGGLGFKGVPNVSLAEASQTFLNRSYDTIGIVHANIQRAASYSHTKEEVKKHLKELQASLERCLVIVKTMRDICESLKPHPNVIFEDQLDQLEEKLEKEIADELLLFFLWDIFYRVNERKLENVMEKMNQREKGLFFINQKVSFYIKYGLFHLKALQKILGKTL